MDQDKTSMKINTYWKWASWFMVTAFLFYQYVLRIFPSVIIDHTLYTYGISPADFSYFSGAYYLGYALMHIPLGVCFDRLRGSWVLLISILLTAVGQLLFLTKISWPLMVMGRFVVGAASTAAVLGVFKTIHRLFPAEQFGRILGFSVAVGLIGALGGGRGVQILIELMGYNKVIVILAVTGAILAALTFVVLAQGESRDKPQDPFSYARVKTDFLEVVRAPQFLMLCFFGALMIGPLEGFADVWVIPFLKGMYGLSQETSTNLQGLIFVAMGGGSPILAFIGERWGLSVHTLIVSALMMLGAFILLQMNLLPSQAFITSLVFITGLFSAYQVLVIRLVTQRVHETHVALAGAITNMIVMSAGFFFHSGIGQIQNILISSFPSMSYLDAFNASLVVIPCGLLFAFIGLIMKRKQLRDLAVN